MNKIAKLTAAVAVALASQTASAGFVNIGGLNVPNNTSIQVASVYENIVTTVGQELKGYGEITQIGGFNIGALCAGCELTFVFDQYIVSSIGAGAVRFTGGRVQLYLGFGAANDFNPNISGSSAADITAATNGTKFLSLKGHDIDALGNTLESFAVAGSLLTPTFRFFGGGLWDVDLTGVGIGNGNFNTDSFLASFGGPTADLEFTTSGSTSVVPHPTECVPTTQQPIPTGASCVAGSADIRANVIPEPGTLALAGLGLLGLGLGAKRRKTA